RGKSCGCNNQVSPTRDIVYPTKEKVVKTYSDETVRHIHPTHTTVVNCHTVKNEHLYPQTTSYENVTNEVNVGPNNTDVAGTTDNMNCGGHHHHHHGRCCRRRRRFF